VGKLAYIKYFTHHARSGGMSVLSRFFKVAFIVKGIIHVGDFSLPAFSLYSLLLVSYPKTF
jgi:hypothetical protein